MKNTAEVCLTADLAAQELGARSLQRVSCNGGSSHLCRRLHAITPMRSSGVIKFYDLFY